MYDLMIAGAGPAGAAAALTARRLDPSASVALIDRATFPRDKSCGDALSPDAVGELARLGVPSVVDGYPAVERIRLRSALGSEVSAAPPSAGYVIPRTVLDARLVDAAMAAGAELITARVRDVASAADRVQVLTSVGGLEGRLLIAADGANSRIRQALGLRPNPAAHLGVAIRGYAPQPPGGPELLMQWFHHDGLAYAWSFPIDGKRVNVGAGVFSSRRQTSRARLTRQLTTLLPHAHHADPETVRGHLLPLSTWRPRLGRGQVLFAGDAASLINPLTGEGIFYALLSGRLAATAFVRGAADPPAAYRASLDMALGRHLRHTGWLARLARRERVLDQLVRAAATSPATLDVLAELAFGKGGLTRAAGLEVLRGLHASTTARVAM